MQGTILLRKLTYKSLIGIGKYADVSVQKMLDLQHTRVLRYYYFNYTSIDYIPEIRERIGITKEFEILKPGKNPDKGEELNLILRNKLGWIDKIKQDGHQRALARGRHAGFKRADRLSFNKGALQRFNHGH